MNLQTKKMPVRRYRKLLMDISSAIEQAKHSASIAINHELVKANWQIGRHIVEFEQHGNEKAEYGSELLSKLSRDLKIQHGKGFSKSSVYLSREFYIQYPIFQTLSGKLSWSHYTLLLAIDDAAAKTFYEKQIEKENWSVREFQRQLDASLYERIALNKSKRHLIPQKRKIQNVQLPHKIVKDPYVLDFLGLKGKGPLSEKVLEQSIIDNLQAFLLELGKGFAFVARQFRISFRNKHYSVDLVFYHRILKCFVLFDLKTRFVRHSDIGQMNLYLNYFIAEENVPGDNKPIGIILSPGKDEFLVEYALGGLSNKIFVSKYQLHLPEKRELKRQLKEFVEVKMTKSK